MRLYPRCASIALAFTIILCLSLVTMMNPTSADSPPTDPDQDPMELDLWNWNGGEWCDVEAVCQIEPSPGGWVTCIGGPVSVQVTMRDTDGWNNLGEHYHGDDKLIAIQAVDSMNPQSQHVWGTTNILTEEGDGPMDRRYTGQIHGVAPLTAQVHMMRFRGIDTPVFGDDPSTNCNPNPGNGMQETGCEYCMCDTTGTDLCCLEIPVIEVIVSVQGNVPGKPQNLCLNANVETNYPNVVILPGNTADVSIDIKPDIPGTQLIPITLDLGDTSVAAFDGNSRSVVIHEGQTKTLTGTGIGVYEIVPKLLFGSSPDLDDPDTAVPCHKRESYPGAGDGGTVRGTVFRLVIVEGSLTTIPGHSSGGFANSSTIGAVAVTPGVWATANVDLKRFAWLESVPSSAYASYAKAHLKVTQVWTDPDLSPLEGYPFGLSAQCWDPGYDLSISISMKFLTVTAQFTEEKSVAGAFASRVSIQGPNTAKYTNAPQQIDIFKGDRGGAYQACGHSDAQAADADYYHVNNSQSRAEAIAEAETAVAADGDLARNRSSSGVGIGSPQAHVILHGDFLLTTKSQP